MTPAAFGVALPLLLFVLLVLLPAAALAAYLGAVAREGSRWSRWRIASFTTGTLLLVVAGLAAVAGRGHHDLRGHMLQHLLLGMFAPIGLVFGAPVTLLLRRLRPPVARRVVTLLATRPLRVLVHPVTAAVLDVGGMYLLYLTPLYALSQSIPAVHVLVHVHFVVSGYLFTWAIAGPDPAPRRPGMQLRLGVLFLATAMHANLGKLMYAYGFPRDVGHDAPEIEAAAMLMYYGGDMAEALLIGLFFAGWFSRTRATRPQWNRCCGAPAGNR